MVKSRRPPRPPDGSRRGEKEPQQWIRHVKRDILWGPPDDGEPVSATSRRSSCPIRAKDGGQKARWGLAGAETAVYYPLLASGHCDECRSFPTATIKLSA
ncbi:hypothetical protein GW17_00013043 [Ensete ventricosum]|nr:hypothetical protein GW17_00013043 [Ensete ventricosum]